MILPATPLPAYDQAQLDKRFLTELERLLDAGAFATYGEWASTVGAPPERVAAIRRGAYHCNLKLLYNTLRHYPTADLGFVLFGSAVYARPEPTQAPRPKQGRPARVKLPTA
jgi:hypothetical protein